MRKMTKRSAAIAAAAAVVIGGAGAAYAWTIGSGSGDAKVTAATIKDVTIAGTTVTAGLYPGGPAGDLKIVVSSLNKFPINVNKAFLTTITTDKPGCGQDDFTVNGTTDNGAQRFDFTAVPVAASDGTNPQTGDVTVTGAVKMDADAADACADATVTVTVSKVHAFVGTDHA